MNTAQADGRARRDILVDTAVRGDAAATVSIGSISEQDWYISRTHGVYHIPGCAKGERTRVLIITARGDALDLGDNRRFPFTITARQIAEDLLQDLHDHGIFICEGARPSSGELATATARREGFYQKLITEGDTMWARGHSFREISDLHRRAAIGLGVGARMGLRADAHGRLPGVRRKSEDRGGGLPALQRDLGSRKKRRSMAWA